jgi:hypothetical protein
MIPMFSDFISTFFSSKEDESYYKKHDPETLAPDSSEEVCIQLLESNSVEDFIEETLEYYTSILEGRPLKYVADLKCGMARVGDGIETEIFWWINVDHPVGAMLRHNQLDPLVVVTHKMCGEMIVYPDAQVRFCIDSIVQLLKDQRSIDLIEWSKSDEEKEASTKISTAPIETVKKED